MAVDGITWRLEIAVDTAVRSVVGGTTICAEAANFTSETLNRGGRSPTNSLAAVLAAESRDGSTSVDTMDRETSMATTTVARSRGTSW